MSRSFGIVVPAYDPDVERLGRYVEALDSLEPATIRIEVDDPAPGVRAALAALPVEVGVADARRGKGAALTAGFEALSTDVYAFADADGSTPVAQLDRVVEAVRSGDADLAAGSRRHPEAAVSASQSVVRERLGDAYAWLARQLLPVSLYDYQCGAKAIDAGAWEIVRGDLYQSGFGWDVEFVSAAAYRGLHVAEVPIEWADAPGSTVDPLAATPSLLGALLRVQRLRLLGSTGSPPLLDRLAETSDARSMRDGGPE